MSEVRVHPDGQIPIPEDLRERMELRPGARVQLHLGDDHTLVVEAPAHASVTRLFGRFRTEAALTLEEMDNAIAEGAAGR